MINKDLNLSLDYSLLEPKSALEQASNDKNTGAALSSLEASNTAVAALKPRPNPPWQNLTSNISIQQSAIVGVVILNAVFLLLAGIWLAEQFSKKPDAESMYAELESNRGVELVELGDQLKNLQRQLITQSDALQQQFEALQLVFRIEQQQIVSGYLDMNAQLVDAINQTQNTSKAAPPTDVQTSTKNWYVNVGTFVNEKAALGLQQQIVDLGYPAKINSLQLDGKVAQRVLIPGFTDRSSAEAAAQNVMETTKLNGLWAWKGR